MKTLKYWYFLFIPLLASLLFIMHFNSYSQEYFITDSYFIDDICISDIDLDGDYDLIVCSTSNELPDTLFIFYNDGIGNLDETSLCRQNGIFVLCGNVDNDEFPDIISKGGGNILFIKNNGDGTFGEEIPIAPSQGSRVIEYISDMDGDGLNDLVYTYNGYYCKWGILRNENNLIFTDHIIFDDGIGGNLFPRIGNLNDDSLPDACLSYLPNGIHTLMNTGNLAFDTTLLCSTKASPRICKLNTSPPDDILIFSHNTDELILYENLGNNLFQIKNILPLINALSSSHLSDLNNDGYDDLAYSICWWTNCTDSIYIRLNDQNWDFTKPQQYYVGPMEILSLESADLNGDNYKDIILYGYASRNAFKILWNDGFGGFSYENPVGLVEQHKDGNNLKILINPNPFASILHVSIESAKNSQLHVSIMDMFGRIQKQFDPCQIRISENLELTWNGKANSGIELPGGIYFLMITENEKNSHIVKIIKY